MNKFASLALAFACTCTAGAGVLASFKQKALGVFPDAPLAIDKYGNLYGTTSGGGTNIGKCGSNGCGTVFMLTPNGSGEYSYSVIYRFMSQPDGSSPLQGGVIIDSAGNLYGATRLGGTNNFGSVYELSPALGGVWTEKILYSFAASATDGIFPNGNLIFDDAGNLYGVTQDGGEAGCGTAYMLSPNGTGGWTETILHSFKATTTDGAFPPAGLIMDASGNLYGTTSAGGKADYGTVFELSPSSGGTWAETQLYAFRGANDGCNPVSSLTLDADGDLYGTTFECGSHSGGTVFELSPSATGWIPKTLHLFKASNGDGFSPYAPVIFDTAGNLFGTTYSGGANGGGSVYKLTPNSDGTWTESGVHQFSGPDGAGPVAGVIFGPGGLLYGTTQNGGTENLGVVFSVNP
jgi:uncharacterized repeat protein (TIGR03803 family)